MDIDANDLNDCSAQEYEIMKVKLHFNIYMIYINLELLFKQLNATI